MRRFLIFKIKKSLINFINKLIFNQLICREREGQFGQKWKSAKIGENCSESARETDGTESTNPLQISICCSRDIPLPDAFNLVSIRPLFGAREPISQNHPKIDPFFALLHVATGAREQ